MRKVRCHECGKSYDFDIDDFCPKCGAFSQPRHSARIGPDGSTIWMEGINEVNHQKSFVHEELHEENRSRRGTPLSKGAQRNPAASMPAARRTTAGRPAEKRQPSSPAKIIYWIVFAIIAANVLGNFLRIFF